MIESPTCHACFWPAWPVVEWKRINNWWVCPNKHVSFKSSEIYIFLWFYEIVKILLYMPLSIKISFLFNLWHGNTMKWLWIISVLTLKAPITTAADDKFCDIFHNFQKKIRHDITWDLSAGRQFSWNIMPYLLFLKKRQSLKLSSAANCRWRFKGLVPDSGTNKATPWSTPRYLNSVNRDFMTTCWNSVWIAIL